MKVSVVINTYNRPKLLKSAVESVLANNYPDFNLIIVDQSNNNETKNLVNEYARYGNRIKYLWSEKGKSGALNLVIKNTNL